jgi:hypothetical protein
MAALMQVGGGLATMALTGSPAFTGLEKIAEALSTRDENGNISADAVGKAVATAPGILVPQVVARLASAMDPFIRDVTGGGVASTALRSIKSRIPGIRETLGVKKDVFGTEQRQNKRPDILSAGLVQGLIPSEKAKALSKMGLTVARPTATSPSSGTFEEYAITPKQKEELEGVLQAATGEAVDDFLAAEKNGEYKSAYETFRGAGVLPEGVAYKGYIQKKLNDRVSGKREDAKKRWATENEAALAPQKGVKKSYR